MPQFNFNVISRIDIERSLGGKIMLNAIDYDGPLHLLVTGCPGSGKTTVTIMRAERLVNSGKKVLLLTFQKLLKLSLVNIASTALEERIDTLHQWYSDNFDKKWLSEQSEDDLINDFQGWEGCDEVLIDEGQDFESKIFSAFLSTDAKMTVGADNAQRLQGAGLLATEIKALLEANRGVYPINLQYNYRNTFEIYNFARNFLPHNERANNLGPLSKMTKGVGQKPIVYKVNSVEQKFDQIKTLLDNAGAINVAILVFNIDEVNQYFEKLSEMGVRCSKHHSNHSLYNEVENVLITTYTSAKGIEFQAVILPDMELAQNHRQKKPEHFYVGCTRAKESLFLLYQSEKIPTILNSFDRDSYNLINMPIPAAKPIAEIDDDLPF